MKKKENIIAVAQIILLSYFLLACKTTNLKTVFHGPEKRTVTFMILSQGMYAFELNPAENAIISCLLSKKNDYLPKYVYVNYDSVSKAYEKEYSKQSFGNKLFYSKKKRNRLYAKAAGTDHLMALQMETIYDTIITPPKKRTVLEKWLLNMKDTPEERSYTVRQIKFTLDYIDGRSGKILWSMRCRYPRVFSPRTNAIDELSYKFQKKFPFKN